MPMTHEEKLADIDERLRRWRPKLTRAHNEVTKLLKIRDALTRKPALLDGYIAKTQAKRLLNTMGPSELEQFVENGIAAQKAVDELTIPEELRVTTDVEALRAERRKKEEAERHKMPLTGKAAMEHIKRRKTK